VQAKDKGVHREVESEGGRDTGRAGVAMGRYKTRLLARRLQLNINPGDAE